MKRYAFLALPVFVLAVNTAQAEESFWETQKKAIKEASHDVAEKATEVSKDVAEKAGEVSSDVADKAEEDGGSILDGLRDIKDDIKDKFK